MVDKQDQALTLIQNLPVFNANEGSELEPIDLTDYIENPSDAVLQFSAELVGGGALPAGITFSADGILSGTPHAGTSDPGIYKITVVAFHPKLAPLVIHLTLMIHGAPESIDIDDFKNYWQKFAEGLELPDLEQLLTRKVTPLDIYYLLGRFATLIIWNADDLTLATKGKAIDIPHESSAFQVYDFGSALVASPKDLYDPKRGLQDAIQTAKAMVHEIKQRKWDIELAGYDKMVTAAWVETQHLNASEVGHKIKIYNYEPSLFDNEVLALSAPTQQL